MNEAVNERLSGLPRFDTKEEALQEAVKRVKADDSVIEMVMRQEDGKFLLCDSPNWEIALVQGGCQPVYGGFYIYDLAAGRNPSEEDNRRELKSIMGGESPGGVKKAMSYDQIRERK